MKKLISRLSCAGAVVTIFSLASCAEDPADGVDKAVVENKETDASVAASKSKSPIEKQTFVITESSKIEFVGSNITQSQAGGFANFVGKFEMANDQLAAGGAHSVAIDMSSIFTNSDKLTDHLKGEDFFDTKKFPTARFELDEAISKGEKQYQLSGTLDLHGVVKKISFPATATMVDGQKLAKISAEFSINRKDFGIVYPGKPDDLIRDEVVIKLDLAAMPGEPHDLQIGTGNKAATPSVTEALGQRPGGARRGGPGGPGGRPDWGNMTSEEREEARRQFIARIDKNGDGNLSKDEMPEGMWNFMKRADKNGDDMVTKDEGQEFRAEMEAQRAIRELLGEDGPSFGGRPGGGPGGGRPGGSPSDNRSVPEETNK